MDYVFFSLIYNFFSSKFLTLLSKPKNKNFFNVAFKLCCRYQMRGGTCFECSSLWRMKEASNWSHVSHTGSLREKLLFFTVDFTVGELVDAPDTQSLCVTTPFNKDVQEQPMHGLWQTNSSLLRSRPGSPARSWPPPWDSLAVTLWMAAVQSICIYKPISQQETRFYSPQQL